MGALLPSNFIRPQYHLSELRGPAQTGSPFHYDRQDLQDLFFTEGNEENEEMYWFLQKKCQAF